MLQKLIQLEHHHQTLIFCKAVAYLFPLIYLHKNSIKEIFPNANTSNEITMGPYSFHLLFNIEYAACYLSI